MRMSLLCTAALLATPALSLGQADQVLITGGVDDTKHNYAWQLTNRSPKRVVSVEFPQYGADMFEQPEGWKQDCTNLVNVGWKKKAGRCIATSEAGLGPGATAAFTMRIYGPGAPVGTGTVLVRFDDGSEAKIPGVTLPLTPQSGTPYLALIGTGLIFVAFVFLRERRRRRAAGASDPQDEQ